MATDGHAQPVQAAAADIAAPADSAESADALFQQATLAHREGRLAAAAEAYRQTLARQPLHLGALHLSGLLALQSGDARQSIDWFHKALGVAPRSAALHLCLGDAWFRLGRYQEADASYAESTRIDPTQGDAHNNRGVALAHLGRHAGAVASFELALAHDPQNAAAWNNRGNSLRELGRSPDALTSFERAIALQPAFAEAHVNRAKALRDLGSQRAALDACDRAIACSPDLAEAHFNRGVVLRQLGDFAGALQSLEAALARVPDRPDALVERGAVLFELQRFDAAALCFERAIALGSRTPGLVGMAMHAAMRICAWDDLEARLLRLRACIAAAEPAASPAHVLTLVDSGGLQRRAAETWAREEFAEQVGLGPIVGRAAGGRIRVGYFSADFRDHATMHLMAGLLELHDRERFEVTGFSFGPVVQDAVRARVESAFERFVEVGHRSDREVAGLSRELSIDIAVDLKGYTSDARPGIFAHRAAPVQVGYLGYPGTLGAGYVDYLIADRMVVPEGSEGYYREQLVYLPDSYQVNDAKRRIGARRYERGELGLPRAGFVYCCFNNNYKIMPATFGSWMRILGRVPGSVLWLLEDNAQAAQNLRAAAAGHGVPAERLVFAPRVVAGEHLARHGCADLFLDTLPCNAHTTASDALWAGLPVLTCVGEGFAARVAGSLVSAVGLPELIVQSMADYEELAVRLAGDAERLGALRARLERNRGTAPLFDTLRHARHLESAYTLIHARHLAGLPPASLEVPALGRAIPPAGCAR
jgi:predicted O-linked N-acetylglucosamine transferase (SPINDLY family)